MVTHLPLTDFLRDINSDDDSWNMYAVTYANRDGDSQSAHIICGSDERFAALARRLLRARSEYKRVMDASRLALGNIKKEITRLESGFVYEAMLTFMSRRMRDERGKTWVIPEAGVVARLRTVKGKIVPKLSEDELKFIAEDKGYVKTVPDVTAYKKDMAQQFAETGEVPDGWEFVPEQESLSISDPSTKEGQDNE